MIALVKTLRSNKQVIWFFCLIVSLPLVFFNIELQLSDLYSNYPNQAAAVYYRKVRQLYFEQQSEEGNGFGLNVTKVAITSEDEEDQFSKAFEEIIKANLENRSQMVSGVCQ